MSLPPGGYSAFLSNVQNPKSILTDRSGNPNSFYNGGSALLRGMNDVSNLASKGVRFAKGVTPTKENRRSNGSSSTSVITGTGVKTPPGSSGPSPALASFVARLNKEKVAHDSNKATTKYNFGAFSHDYKIRDEGGKTANEKHELGGGKGKKKSSKNISVLYPSDNYKKSNKGTALDSSRGRSEDSLASARASKTAKSTVSESGKATMKSATRSLVSTTPKRVKSGKKLKKRRKSKQNHLNQEDKDLNTFKPAKLDEEYASELGKITQILKAVSAFDESTGTDNPNVRDRANRLHSRNNLVTNYTYTDANRLGSVGFSPSSLTKSSTGQVRRPLSGLELKQLLSSITRVVSLHQLPTTEGGIGLLGSTAAIGPSEGKDDLNMTTTMSTSAALEEYRQNLLKSAIDNITSAPTKKSKKKKSRKSLKSSHSRLGSNSDLLAATTKTTTRKLKPSSARVGGTPSRAKSSPSHLRRLSKPKYKSGRHGYLKPKKAHSDNSISSSEKDPVKNALFLRKYFEESVRLANKKSSEELIQGGSTPQGENDKAANKSSSSKTSKLTKKKKKKKSVASSASKKLTSKTV